MCRVGGQSYVGVQSTHCSLLACPVISPSLLNIYENFYSFLKKVEKKFGDFEKTPYLCNRF